MALPLESKPPIATPPSEVADASVFGRVFAFLAGLVLVLLGAFMSFGLVLFGIAGMGIATLARHRRRRRLTRFGGWISSTVSVAGALAVLLFVVAEMVPARTWHEIKVSMDSASTASAKEPPPAWAKRMFPGMSQRAAQRRTTLSASTITSLAIAGYSMVGTFFAAFWGTLAWAAGMLLGFGTRGRWPGAPVSEAAEMPTA
jgi:hypothetical protein